MDFKVGKKETPVKEDDLHSRQDIHTAYTFAKNIYKEFGHFLRAIILFGSKAREPNKKEGDIDILLIVDDVSFYVTQEVIETYRVILEKNILTVSKKIHVTTIKFSSFWEYIRIADPIGINILRDGVALIDTGFFSPLQMLLYQGRIRPTKEATIAYFAKAPQTLHNSRWHIMQATLDLYWAVIDASHAALMKSDVLPPTPEKIPDLLEELVKKKLIDKHSPKTMRTFYNLSKQILHREIKEMNGKDYEKYHEMAKSFVEDIRKYIDKK